MPCLPSKISSESKPAIVKKGPDAFSPINRAYHTVFTPGRLSLGLVAPLENHHRTAVATLTDHIERIQLAEKLGFSAIWLRDIPFNVPSFGDAGQIHDPWVYLGLLSGQTQDIALGVASIVLPLRHPAHVAKAAASADVLSSGRLLLGVASGDRPDEYPALGLPFEDRGQRFREGFDYIRRMSERSPSFSNAYGAPGRGLDMLPKPTAGRLPLLITGGSQQNPNWVAQNGDGWMLYPRPASAQKQIINEWRDRVETAGRPPQPVMQSLYLDLSDDPTAAPRPIHLGFRSGVPYLVEHLKSLQAAGVNHVALNLRFNQATIESTLEQLAEEVFPHFKTPPFPS